MSQLEAAQELGAAMENARLVSQHSYEVMEDADKDADKEPDKDPDEEEEEEEEEVQHDQQAHGIVSYDNIHKQLSASVATRARDPDYEFEGMRRCVTLHRFVNTPLCY